ncbi:MAG TPA: OPT family oligopeptide transporter [Oscillatoriaceae cyanobacterium]
MFEEAPDAAVAVEAPAHATASPAAALKALPPEEREAYWYKHVYRPETRQLTWRAVIMGVVLGGALSLSNLYIGLKTGLGIGVAITAGILAFAVFKALEKILPGGKFTDLENNAMQSVASAAGFMASSGLISAIPALLLLNGTTLNPYLLAAWITAISLLGVVVAVPVKRQMVNIDQLPFPSGTAAAETIRSLHGGTSDAMDQAVGLGIAGLIAGVVTWLQQGGADVLNLLAKGHHWLKYIAWSLPPDCKPFPGVGALTPAKLTVGMDLDPLLYATGAIIGIRTGVSLFLGAIFTWYGLAPWLVQNHIEANGKVIKGGFSAVAHWTSWPSTTMLIVVTLLTLGMQWKSMARAVSGLLGTFKRAGASDDEIAAKIEVPGSWFLGGMLLVGGVCVGLQYFAFGINPLLGIISVVLTLLLSMVVARITGETDIAQNGPMGKITQLFFGIVAPTNPLTNMMTANVTAGAALHTSDLLTDLKSGYLLGANPRQQFLAQIWGVAAGSLVCVPAYNLLVPNKEALGDKLPAPAAIGWEVAAKALTQGLHAIPPTAFAFMGILTVIGVLITLIEHFVPKSRNFLPSPIGFGMAMVLPFHITFAIFGGSLIGWICQKVAPKASEKYLVAVSSGIIAGDSLVAIGVLGIEAALHMF